MHKTSVAFTVNKQNLL